MEGDGVAYMVMGEGGEAGQATQVVAVDNGDGTQQLVSTRATCGLQESDQSYKASSLKSLFLVGNTSDGPGNWAGDLYDH